MSFGAGDTTTTSQVKYSPAQQALIDKALPTLTGTLQNPFKLPDFLQTQPFNPTQQLAQSQALAAAQGPVSQFTDQIFKNAQFLSGPALSPDTNPYLAQTAEAAIRPVTRALTSEWLPAIRGGAIESNVLGGSRQGLAEGKAIERAATAASDVSGRIYSDAYQQGVNNLVKNMALAPQTASLGLYPSSVIEGVGAQQYGLESAFGAERYNRNLTGQQLPYLTAKDVLGTALGLGTGTTATQVGGAGGGIGSIIGGGLGGAATLGGLAGLPGMAALGGPWGLAAGAGLGALAAMFR